MSGRIPSRYVPKSLSQKDKTKQRKSIIKSRSQYKKGIYKPRPPVKSFKSKPSPHVKKAKRIYKVKAVGATKEYSKKTGCSVKALKKITSKGRGAYYSSGSRPNQSAQSWAISRLASSTTGSKASKIDYKILKRGCKKGSLALKLARK